VNAGCERGLNLPLTAAADARLTTFEMDSAMQLIDWNETTTSGRGRTGALYTIARIGPSWAVSVDGDVVCAAPDAAKSVDRAEALEALKHIVTGRGRELDMGSLHRAGAIAAEMKKASDVILDDPELPPNERDMAQAYSEHLGMLLATIYAQTQRRSAAPLN
jgi:hypothetical protein